MKKLLTWLILIAVITVFCTPVSAQILWRSAKTMKKGSVIAMGEWYYYNLTKVYDWDEDKWNANPNDHLKWGVETMFGYAISDRWEAMAHIPLQFHSFKTSTMDESNSGIGDICLKTRYAVIPWAKDRHGLTLLGQVRLGTGDWDYTGSEAILNTGDGGTDFGLGGIFTTAVINQFMGHLKLNYWLNGENENKVKMGNELKFIAKLDRIYNKKIKFFATYIYYNQGDKKVDGVSSDETNKIRHTFVLGGVYNPKSGWFIRPKISMFLGGEGGMTYTLAPKLDIWYIFSL